MQRAAKLFIIEEVESATGFSRRTLSAYVQAGLIEPPLKEGATLSYPDTTIERLKRIRRLKEDLGVNLAGIEVILEMREKIEHLQEGLDEVVRFVHKEMKEELAHACNRSENALVPRPLAKPPQATTEK
jgi:MerR family transcriptional regulator/heat shock protein HspR